MQLQIWSMPCVQHVMKSVSKGCEISLKASTSAATRSMQMNYFVCQAHNVSKKAIQVII